MHPPVGCPGRPPRACGGGATPKRGRGQERAEERVDVLRPRGVAWPPVAGDWLRPGRVAAELLLARGSGWLEAERTSFQFLPWLAIGFGFGIVLYFAAGTEPAPAAALGLVAVCAVFAVAMRNRPPALILSMVALAIAAGFAVACVKRVVIEHEMLRSAVWNAAVSGFVEAREQRERTDRIVVKVVSVDGLRLREKPARVRVSLKKGTAPPVGAFVEFRARLTPPLEPLRAGGYDYARDLYFKGIGASGFVLGAIRIREPPPLVQPGLNLAVTAYVQGLREAIDARIRAVLEGDHAAIASALITGKRDAISASANEAMYVSSLAHVLSISGYHMAVVAGLAFFVLRAILALSPTLASNYPIKKWSAFGAFLVAAFYLLLSGAEVATQRSFIMVAIVLCGVMLDRPALTLRTLAIAAFAVLAVMPEAVVHPSFQMSFAATLILIAGYRAGLDWTRASAENSFAARMALWGIREVAMLVIASLLAGLATALFAAYHFHRFSSYGVLSNLLAMPVVSAWVMPAGILGVVSIPFGFDGIWWRIMGEGIDWMVAIAQWVSDLPGALVHLRAFGVGPLLLATGGLVVFCLMRSPLRSAGLIVMIAAGGWAMRTPPPDILIAPGGASVAVRTAEGRLAILRGGSDAFVVRNWLAADGDSRDASDKALAAAFTCDDLGCVARLADGRLLAAARHPAALDDDCAHAALVVAAFDVRRNCEAALVIDRQSSLDSGGREIRLTDSGLVESRIRPKGIDRPWRPARSEASEGAAASASRAGSAEGTPQDATPRAEDLDPDD